MDTAASSGDGTLSVEIGNHYAIIGMDGREYKIEVIGKRVSDIDSDVYIHYEGTDKRLDEWVDVQRILTLKGPPTGNNTQASTVAPVDDTNNKDGALPPETNVRPKRKIVRDEVTLLVESLTSPFRKRTGAVGGGRGNESSSNSPGLGKHLDDDDDDLERVRNVEWILYAGYDIATWYYSPFPEEYHDCQRLFICDYCLKYIRHVDNYVDHTRTCKRKRPPGTVVYSKGVNKIYKVNGSKEKLYCQNLSLLAKLFLDNKTLYFDVNGFHFFVLTETRAGDRSDVPVGFFSKETVSYDGYNLACILVLPPFQRKSYGKLLIEFSYELTKIEGKVGSPEKPLSDLGKLGYVSYWVTAILRELYPKPWPAKRHPPLLPLSGKSRNRAASLKPGSQSTASLPVPPSGVPPSPSPSSSSIATSIASEATSLALLTAVKKEPVSHLTSLASMGHRNTSGPLEMELNSVISPSLDENASLSTTDREGEMNKEIAFSIRELASKTGIMEEDLLETLVIMGWMKHWLPPKAQDLHPPVKEAKRSYRKLMRFHEQQRLLDAYGIPLDSSQEGHGHDFSHQHQHFVRQEHPLLHSHSSEAEKEITAHAIEGENVSHPTGIRRYFTSSSPSGTNSGNSADHASNSHKLKSSRSTPETSLSTLEYLEQQRKALMHEFDPVAILEIPDSEDEDEDDHEHKKENSVYEDDDFQTGSSQYSQLHSHKPHQSHHSPRHSSQQHHGSSLLSHSDLNPVDVAVVSMDMVKAYQDKFNIRLDPYIDRDAIDWNAYHKSLSP